MISFLLLIIILTLCYIHRGKKTVHHTQLLILHYRKNDQQHSRHENSEIMHYHYQIFSKLKHTGPRM